MTVDIRGITDALVSHARALGVFESVNPVDIQSGITGGGIAVSVYVASLSAHPPASGLDVTGVRLTMSVRLYAAMPLAEPMEHLDPRMIEAAEKLLMAYGDNFSLGGAGREISMMGLVGVAGVVAIGDRRLRTFTITIPITVYDVWGQAR